MMAKLYANDQSITINGNGTITTNRIIINGGQFSVPEISSVSPSETALKQTVGPSVYWSREEQSLLEELIVKYASDSIVMRYAKIAVKLLDKTLKDVALRYRWMIEKEKRKQRKKMQEKNIQEEVAYQQVKPPSTNNSSDECVDEEISYKEQLLEQIGQTINHVPANGYAFKGKAVYQSDEDIDDEISYKAIGGAAARLLEQNDQAINQILANVSAKKLHENIILESQTRNNINALLYESLYNMPEMKPLARQLYDFHVHRRVKRKMDFSI